MMLLEKFSDGYFELVHLTEDVDVSTFTSKKGYGLEVYLKKHAINDEKNGLARTYLVVDSETKQIAAYFSLRTGLITVSRGAFKGFDAYTGIELANFATNDAYRVDNEILPRYGTYVFSQFIFPLVTEIAKYVGVAYLYIYSLPNNKLMEHYKTMGFSHASKQITQFIYSHVKPAYDSGCIFMWQKL